MDWNKVVAVVATEEGLLCTVRGADGMLGAEPVLVPYELGIGAPSRQFGPFPTATSRPVPPAGQFGPFPTATSRPVPPAGQFGLLPVELVAQVDTVAKRLSVRAGTLVTRTEALRVIIARGVQALAAEGT